MKLLTDEFLNKYPDQPEHMNSMAQFVFYRTYSRWLDDEKRRETWKEAVTRAVEYNSNLAIKQHWKNNFTPNIDAIRNETETLFDNIFNLRQFLSGRTHWVGGARSGVADKFPLANFNCAFVDVVEWNDLCDLFYMLLIGTGMGFKCTKENAHNLTPIRTDYTLIHSNYVPLPAEERIEYTKVNIMENGYAKIYIGDSKEGWVEALKWFFALLTSTTYDHIKHIKISYNSIRPKGERLKTFGGTASGYQPMKEMFEGIDSVIKGTIDPWLDPLEVAQPSNRVYVRPIHILDIGNLIGNNVVVGGVRRTAEIFLCDADDWECIFAKWGINGEVAYERWAEVLEELSELEIPYMPCRSPRNINHRRMSNNSIVFNKKPDRKFLEFILKILQNEGEPGFVNLESANKRRPNCKGLNPCAEVLLDSYGVCNLTTVNVAAFIIYDDEGRANLDVGGLMQAQALSARAALRMTCLDLELPRWDVVQKRDRLTGCSLTGFKDAIEAIGYDEEMEEKLLFTLQRVATEEVMVYSQLMRIPMPLLHTTVKPEGTLSQVANGVSSGLHMSYAPYYIRRIRINANDPLLHVARELDWCISPEVGSDLNDVRTYVIDFPCKSTAKKTRNEQNVINQFETYFRFQDCYAAHNSSNTIYVKDDEWGVVVEILDRCWDNFIGISFLPYDGGTYELAPYEEIDEETYNRLIENMKPFDSTLLTNYEAIESLATEDGIEGCESGICPIR